MAVTPARAKTLALSLENASSYPHFERIAFRTPRRTFATLALTGGDMNFAFNAELQAHFCRLAPHAMTPVPGGWGRMGFTRCDLKAVDTATFKQALLAAHARANAPLPKRSRQGPAKKKAATKVPAQKRGR